LGAILGYLLNLPKLSFPFDLSLHGRFQKLLLLVWGWESFLPHDTIRNNDFEKPIAHCVFGITPKMFSLKDGKVFTGGTNAAERQAYAPSQFPTPLYWH
jgi:hypothetical protein